jgi:diguanylate cyclase (GGDEF)-like protein
MDARRATLTGLDTRVAASTFAMFCLCAVVPILLSAFIADHLVSRKFRALADSQLTKASKGYGLFIFQRLKETDETLAQLASLYLQGELTLQGLRNFDSPHFRVVDVRADAAPVRSTGANAVEPLAGTITLVDTIHEPVVLLTVSKSTGGRPVSITAALDNAYLWDMSGVELQSMRTCVRTEAGRVLRCSGEMDSDAGAANSTIDAQWLLYLRARYGAATWTVQSSQRADIALAGLSDFRHILPAMTLIAIVVASLLSVVQIRRSHRPLALLVEAAESVGRQEFDRRLVVHGNDEYAQLATAFNRMVDGLEERSQALLQRAYYDELTGLPNRQLFKDRLHQELAHAKRSRTEVALIYIDLDRFKHVNDSLGHSAGDELLKAVSTRLACLIRDTDTLARVGGDEFIVIASSLNDYPAHVLAERLQAALQKPLVIRDVSCFVSASFGMTMYPRDGDSEEVLLRNADTAMYRAKAAGGGQAMYFEEGMDRDAQRRLVVEQRLRVALQNRSLRLLFQPKVSLVDGSVCGVEALARWTDTELGIVSPAVFVPIAEECGLIDEMGAWALRAACETFQAWLRDGYDVGHVSVNASMRQLRGRRFVQEVLAVLQDTGIRASALEIEVTESTLADRPEEVAALLEELRVIGVRIAIDDFGTGYSSMAALAQLPIDVVKIDRTFVTDCATRRDAASLVEAVISMAHVLGKITVAEGVETCEQLATLSELGCDVVQGYLFARPMPADELRRLPLRLSAVPTEPAAAVETAVEECVGNA